MAIALGNLCFGVSKDVRPFVGVVEGRPMPTPEPRPPMPGLGVFREGDPIFEIPVPVGRELGPLNLVGLAVADVRLGLEGSRVRLPFRFNPLKGVVAVLIRGRAEGVTASDSMIDVDEAGVTRPLEYGVCRAEFDGVMRPEE